MCCRRMNSKGLVRFLLAKRKESVALRAKIAAAVEESVDAMRLVLDTVEEFVEMKVEGKVGMADRRWACGMLIQVAVPLVEPGGGGNGGVASSVREKAAVVLKKWRGVMGGGESGVWGGEATMFLQMVVGFGLKEKFEEEYLRKLVVEFAARRDMAKLAVALGFGDKMKVRGPPSHRPPKAGRFSNASPSFRPRNPPPQPHHTAADGRFSSPYNYAASHSVYEGGPGTAASYGPRYGGALTQSPAAALPQQYPFATQDIGATGGLGQVDHMDCRDRMQDRRIMATCAREGKKEYHWHLREVSSPLIIFELSIQSLFAT
ncbi:FRIGIDA-like protein 4a [Camellia lanceoleosa]|uniref:FRIGIDA-like protein 4a n=1 Tax=Camellia lanceoleosa TaxID=1840588 RepID=A0ACC0FNV6_9ERIC|nr:FRIGIDA-like protein 4a [Camellia lanceoleosa]